MPVLGLSNYKLSVFISGMEELKEDEKEEIKILKEDSRRLDEKINELENTIMKIRKFDSIALNLFKDKKVKAAMLKAMMKNGIGKELVGMVG